MKRPTSPIQDYERPLARTEEDVRPGEGRGRRTLKVLWRTAVTVPWQFFLGACLLAGAALLPHAPLGPVLEGMALAGVVQFVWILARRNGGR